MKKMFRMLNVMHRSFGYRRRPNRRHKRSRFNSGKALSTVLSILFFLFVGWVVYKGITFIFSGEASAAESVELTINKGRVKYQLPGDENADDWSPALSEQSFFEGESVRTANNTRAYLELFGTNTIFLDSDTELTFDRITLKSSGKKEVLISLKKGQIWAKVSGDDFSVDSGSKFIVDSPYLNTQVHGAAFNLESSTIQDTIQLIKGDAKVKIKSPEDADKTLGIDLGVGQKLVGNGQTYGKLSNNQDVIEIIENSFLESDWNLDSFEQFYPQDAADIKRRLELEAAKNKPKPQGEPTETTGSTTLEAPKIISPADQARFDKDTESVKIEGSVPEGTFQVAVNGYTLTKYVPGAKKFQYFASTKFGTIVAGENKYSVVVTDKDGNSSAPAEITIFYEGEAAPQAGNTNQINADNINDFTNPSVTSPAIFQVSPDEIYQTSASVVTFSGTVDPKTNAVEVNGFRLKKFRPGNTEFSYIANANYGNMKEGENLYTITAFGPDDKTASTQIKIFYSPINIVQ